MRVRAQNRDFSVADSTVKVTEEENLIRQVPLRDINIAVNGCSGFATSAQLERAIDGYVDITL